MGIPQSRGAPYIRGVAYIRDMTVTHFGLLMPYGDINLGQYRLM